MEKSLKKHFPLFVLVTLIAFVIAFLGPFIMGVYLSFTEFKTVTNSSWVGLQNYITAFNDEGFRDSLWFTVKFTVVSVITINLIAFGLALLLTGTLKGTNLFRTVFFMPNLIGGIVLGYIWLAIINSILYQFDVTIMYKPEYGFWGLVILMNWQLIGYMMIIYIAGIQNIPVDIIEAAQIDGANRFQMLRKITLPLVAPSATISLFLTLTNSFKLFDQNLALTNGGPAESTTMVALDIYNTFYGRVGWEGVGQAKGVIFFVIVGIIAITQVVLTRRKEIEN